MADHNDNEKHVADNQPEEIIDSDELLDLDMPLDEVDQETAGTSAGHDSATVSGLAEEEQPTDRLDDVLEELSLDDIADNDMSTETDETDVSGPGEEQSEPPAAASENGENRPDEATESANSEPGHTGGDAADGHADNSDHLQMQEETTDTAIDKDAGESLLDFDLDEIDEAAGVDDIETTTNELLEAMGGEDSADETDDSGTLDDAANETRSDGDEITQLNLDELEETFQTDNEESVSSLEKEIGHISDWDEPESATASAASSETAYAQISPEENSANSEHPYQPADEQPATAAVEHAGNAKPRFGLDIANSIMLSLGLIAILIAALAVWIGLDASHDAATATSAPKQAQKQISALEKQQEQQNLVLMRQIETLQQQLNDLTKVVAEKRTEQWRDDMEQPATAIAQTAPAESQPDQPIAEQKPAPIRKTAAKRAAKPEPVTSAKAPVAAKPAPKRRPAPVKSAPAKLAPFEVAAGTVKGWVVNLQSVETRKAAEHTVRRFRAKDIKAEYVRVPVKGKTWFRIRVSGFENEREARAFSKFLKEYDGIKAWQQLLK